MGTIQVTFRPPKWMLIVGAVLAVLVLVSFSLTIYDFTRTNHLITTYK